MTTNNLIEDVIAAVTWLNEQGHSEGEVMARLAVAHSDLSRAMADVRRALRGHPRCDRHLDGEPISCGWKSAVASVQAALDALPDEQHAVMTAVEFGGDALKLANEIVRLHRVIDEKVADLDEAAGDFDDLVAALDTAGITVDGGGGKPFEITVHRDGPLSAPGLRAAANTMQLLGRPLYANELRIKAEQAEAAGS